MLRTEPNRPLDQPPFLAGKEIKFDWDDRLSIDLIRKHAKIEDVPACSDEQLKIYRAAAVESAEHYTGLLLSGQRTMTELIEGPSRVRPGVMTYGHRLQYPVADGYVYLYGGSHVTDNITFTVLPGTRKIKIPIRKDILDLSNCCNPCSSWHVNGGMMAAYTAGYRSIDDVPNAVMLGLMQYITWCVEHPGDELLTQRNRIETRAGLAGLQGTNNIAMISGALETWRVVDPEAI